MSPGHVFLSLSIEDTVAQVPRPLTNSSDGLMRLHMNTKVSNGEEMEDIGYPDYSMSSLIKSNEFSPVVK